MIKRQSVGLMCSVLQALFSFRICLEISWEKIHHGKWQDVPMVWRDLYSFCSAGCSLCSNALASLSSVENTSSLETLTEILKVLDLGLLMGGDQHHLILTEFVKFIEDGFPENEDHKILVLEGVVLLTFEYRKVFLVLLNTFVGCSELIVLPR